MDFEADESVHLADHIVDDEAFIWGDLPLRYTEERGEGVGERPTSPGPDLIKSALTLILVALVLLVIVAVAGMIVVTRGRRGRGL